MTAHQRTKHGRETHRLSLPCAARVRRKRFADLYCEVPEPCTEVTPLPVVSKPEMMRHFDGWVTDSSVIRQGVEEFIADPSLVGHDYLDRYVVCTTSGSTGTPALLVHDRDALTVYNVPRQEVYSYFFRPHAARLEAARLMPSP